MVLVLRRLLRRLQRCDLVTVEVLVLLVLLLLRTLDGLQAGEILLAELSLRLSLLQLALGFGHLLFELILLVALELRCLQLLRVRSELIDDLCQLLLAVLHVR